MKNTELLIHTLNAIAWNTEQLLQTLQANTASIQHTRIMYEYTLNDNAWNTEHHIYILNATAWNTEQLEHAP
jgi:hypothetical protein